MKFYIITPAKDEEKYIERCILSVIKQEEYPQKWIIVNDMSVDKTKEIVQNYSKKYDWIQLVDKISEEADREYGTKILNVFYEGYSIIENEDYDFFTLLDADIELPFDYFNKVIRCFKDDKKIGLCGGKLYNLINNNFVYENSGNYHVRGAFKTYRKDCFISIGGFKNTWNWDGLDDMETLYNGWRIKIIDIQINHLKPTGSHYDMKNERMMSAVEMYKTRYSVLWVFMKLIQYFIKKPRISGGYYFILGYLKAIVTKETKVVSKELGRFIRKTKWKILINDYFGKEIIKI